MHRRYLPTLILTLIFAVNAVEERDRPVRVGARGLVFELRPSQISMLCVNGAREAWPQSRPR